MAGSEKIIFWDPQRTPLSILRVKSGTYKSMVYISYAKLKSNKIKFDLRFFLYFKIIDFHEILFLNLRNDKRIAADFKK